MHYRSRAIILKNRDLRDADQLVSIFSEQEGKITAAARGVKKPRSSLRACVQPFCHSWLFFNRGRDMDLITQGKIIDFYGNTREDLQRLLYVMYMMELLDKSLMEKVPLPELYLDLLQVLENINQQGLNPMLIRYFETRLLVNLGYKPVLNQCVSCGRQDFQAYYFSLGEGGLICQHCLDDVKSVIKLRGESVGLIRLLADGALQTVLRVKASPESARQIEVFLEGYLEYHLERKFKVKSTIRYLKQSIPVSI